MSNSLLRCGGLSACRPLVPILRVLAHQRRIHPSPRCPAPGPRRTFQLGALRRISLPGRRDPWLLPHRPELAWLLPERRNEFVPTTAPVTCPASLARRQPVLPLN